MASSALLVSNVEQVPISGRRHVVFVSRGIERQLGESSFEQILQSRAQDMVSEQSAEYRTLRRVVERLIKHSGQPALMQEQWQLVLLRDPTPNAMVLPGGKIVVFTGILPIMQNEDGAAIILAHEISHVLARHAVERLGWQAIGALFSVLISIVLGQPPDALLNVVGFAGLPFSRKHELEADVIGLHLATRACFDYTEGKRVWQRMAQLPGAQRATDFFDTHPSSDKRERKMLELEPAMKELAKKCNCLQ